MEKTTFDAEVGTIRQRISQLPGDMRERLGPMLEQILESHQRRQQLIGEAMDSLAELRVQMKYLIFDLEATRRENDELRRRLGEA
jgi:hypothetical protein